MPKLTKKEKHEWDIFINADGKRQYTALCRRCIHECKQSYKVVVLECRKYEPKRKQHR